MMIYKFRDNFGSFNFKMTLISLGKILLATALMAFIADRIYILLAGKISHILALFAAIILAGLVYLFVILIARIPEVMDLVNQFYHKFFGKKQSKRVAQRRRKNRY